MRYVYTTSDKVCSREIVLEIEDGIVRNVRFVGGCSGNTQGVANLVAGMKADEVIARLRNIECGSRGSSCPAELATALEQALADQKAQEEDTASKDA